ncbi:MAG: bifunctional UDP-N-acetylglucosamine diphosphorylase/glucosamine-1-phosphate N-acetyltransferase GlmU [Bdellovibrionales bacterium]|nr:bifunctional UDP-N-acetylglucosamine diphosphorylase/glucosamine-1-phosphate N-acetyltransferase GlmU [Bdellovibrionales bacterium]
MTNTNTQQRELTAIILAAGQGQRMKSPLPKVLHPIAGRPMIQYVIEAVRSLRPQEIRAVVGVGENLVRPMLEPQGISCHRQVQQLGTADAVKSVNIESLEGTVLIINGDHPLIEGKDLEEIIKKFDRSGADLSVVTVELKHPGKFGRIVRHYENIKAIVEAKDASAETLKIREINTGIYLVKADILKTYLPGIKNQNAQNEYYLTDIVSACVEAGKRVTAIPAPKHVAMGVNTQQELSEASRWIFKRNARKAMEAGVIIIDPKATYIESEVMIGAGSVLYPGSFLKGQTAIGPFCVIEPNVFIQDCLIEQAAQIRAGSYLEKSLVRTKATVGPYARLRPGTDIGAEAHIGNFVELKKARMGARSKAGHLTYLGDAEIGEDTNIGCGTITCNYAVDKKKYVTKIGKNVFVGSDTQFVAPITIGDNAVIGSGSTITKDVPENALAVARGKQIVKENYVKPQPQSERDSEKE